MDWALQLNMYRMMLEKQGFTVSKMVIQAMCRDYSPRTALERGITENIYLIPIRKISDHWIDLYFKTKAAAKGNDKVERNFACRECGVVISEKVYHFSKQKYGTPLCYECQKSARQSA